LPALPHTARRRSHIHSFIHSFAALPQLVASPAAAQRAESRRLARFVRMLAVGVPPAAVRSAMAREGLRPETLDALAFAPLLL
jgi:hypothetical protein